MFWDDPLFWIVLLIVAGAFYLTGLAHNTFTPPPDEGESDADPPDSNP